MPGYLDTQLADRIAGEAGRRAGGGGAAPLALYYHPQTHQWEAVVAVAPPRHRDRYRTGRGPYVTAALNHLAAQLGLR